MLLEGTLHRALCLVVALGCGPRDPAAQDRAAAWVPDPAPDLGAVVARVGEVPIFAGEVEAQALASGKPPRLALEDLIAFHLLAEKARAIGIRAEQAAAAVPRELLVQRLLEREFEPTSRDTNISDQELHRLYERGKDSFVHPRLVEIAILAVYTGARMKPEPRARARAAAQELAEHVAKRPVRTGEDLLGLAREQRWIERNVAAMRLLQGPDKPFGPAVGAAVMRLREPGETTPLIEDETGLYIARYISERPEQNLSFAQAREQIRKQAYPHWRRQRFGEMIVRLARGHEVEAFPGRIAQSLARP
jgi:hypothetical protein